MPGEMLAAQNPTVVVVELAAAAAATEIVKSIFKSALPGSILAATMITDTQQVNANSTTAYAAFQVLKAGTLAFQLSLGVLNSSEAIAANGGTALTRNDKASADFDAGVVIGAKVAKTGAGFATVAGRLAVSFVQGSVSLE